MEQVDAAQQDSPLSIAANIAGILTFVVAIVAAVWAQISYLRNSDQEYFRVKTSLSWFKTESTWLAELVKAAGQRPGAEFYTEYQMYRFVMDDLVTLEKRLLEVVEETEAEATSDNGKRWALVPKRWGATWAVAKAWLPVRANALELVRQRDALTARVSFTQISMVSSRIRDLEYHSKWRETTVDASLRQLENVVEDQKAEIHRLEDLMRQVVGRDRGRVSAKDLSPTESTGTGVSMSPRADRGFDRASPEDEKRRPRLRVSTLRSRSR